MLSSIFHTCGFAVKIYSYFCIAYIFLSWVNRGSTVGFLAELCEPYLRIFRRWKFTQIGYVDFSPILALGVLSIISQVFFSLAYMRLVAPIDILLALVKIVWSFLSFVINFFIIILVLRLILDFIPEYRNGNIANMLDRFLAPVFVKIYELSGRKFMTARKQIIICLIAVITIRLLLGMLVGSGLHLFRAFSIV